MLTLVLGGARSGKSRHAEALAKQLEQTGKRVIYVATAKADDDEMHHRILRHQNDRPSHWQTIETPVDLAHYLQHFDDQVVILIDCLTLWMSNLLMLDDKLFDKYKNDFLDHLTSTKADVIMVSNETGLGVVPMGKLTRRFVDEIGFLHQAIAAKADQVIFCVAGLPMTLKG
ncbi:bifunctional adenosylcobinamide kinase/adenosylcobinamide-phosphate guanylyltransferase [Moraxella canis]|uniref:Bifunctional adenosylcobalamin biosynthesis protein n=1 Tax=Moraxella canis TaxID=90239 RepID=A0A1S9ZQA6_9GAMM|nr:bifunctional adenosylcobinamide kinase/adenosylcobinamide-phosphate guanylyltransferase [Moraxella canis]OOR85558.1 bifunctional adenosylcobinamide kinase/adenosylcobinamide-phosphate guanylyltransferase [Moraxella canis]